MINNNTSFFDMVIDFLDLKLLLISVNKNYDKQTKVDKPTKAYLLTYYIRILLYIDFEKISNLLLSFHRWQITTIEYFHHFLF